MYGRSLPDIFRNPHVRGAYGRLRKFVGGAIQGISTPIRGIHNVASVIDQQLKKAEHIPLFGDVVRLATHNPIYTEAAGLINGVTSGLESITNVAGTVDKIVRGAASSGVGKLVSGVASTAARIAGISNPGYVSEGISKRRKM